MPRAGPGLALSALLVACGGRDQPGPAASPVASPAVELVRRALPRFEAQRARPFPPSADRVRRGREALAAGQEKRAFHLFRRELEDVPENDEAALYLGIVYFQRSNVGAARPYFERVLEAGPTFAEAEQVFSWYGLTLRRLGDQAGARAALEAFARFSPEDGKSRYFLGEITLEAGELELAEGHFRAALDAYLSAAGARPDADIAAVYHSLGELYLQQGRLEDAESALRDCVRLQPERYDSQYKLAHVLELRGDAQAAERIRANLPHHP